MEVKPEVEEENVITPPDTLKPIIDKTIEYVIRNGINFEAELRKRNGSSTKFAFLLPESPYYPYYRKTLNEKLDPEEAEKLRVLRLKEKQKEDDQKKVIQRQTTVKTLSLKEKLQQEMKLTRIPKEMYIRETPLHVALKFSKVKDQQSNCYWVRTPPKIKPHQVDFIKLTAQFVARNGRKFLTKLSEDKKHDASYDFLDPYHQYWPYFSGLVNAYAKVIVPPPGLKQRLEEDSDLETLILKSFGYAEHMRQEEEREQQKQEDEENEKMQMQLIDWHRFVVLETLDFDAGEVYPAPGRNITEINEILNNDNRANIKVTLADDVDDDVVYQDPEDMEMDSEAEEEVPMDMENSEDEEAEKSETEDALAEVPVVEAVPEPVPEPEDSAIKPEPEGVVLDEEDLGAVPRLETAEQSQLRMFMEDQLKKRAADNNLVESPFTGDMIPLHEISEHIRIMLLNPQWKEQKDLLMDKMRTTSLADNTEIVRNLSLFTQHRTQLTGGTGAPKNETIVGKSSGWDGFRGSEKAAQTAAMKRDIEKEPERRKQQMLEERENAKKQNEVDMQANRLVPAPAPARTSVATAVDADGNATKKRMVAMKGVHRSIQFNLPNGSVTTQSIDLGTEVGQIKKLLAQSIGFDPEGTTLVGPGNVVLDNSFTFGQYDLAENCIVFLKAESN